jgi:hypothetical protein
MTNDLTTPPELSPEVASEQEHSCHNKQELHVQYRTAVGNENLFDPMEHARWHVIVKDSWHLVMFKGL